MPPRVQKKLPPRKATPLPAKLKADPIIKIKPRVDLVALAKKSLDLRTQHTKSTRTGFGQPVKPAPVKVIRYILECDDGTALYAEGHHADVLYRYIQECEQLCNVQGLAHYGGPGMERISKADVLIRLTRTVL
jgi:hypothetical protein